MAALAAVPAFVALLFKAALLAFAIRSPNRNATTRLFILFLSLLSIYNVVEVLGLTHFASHGLDTTMERYGFTYFASVIIYTAVMLHVTLRISVDHWDRIRPIVPLIYAPALALEILLLSTDKLVAGFQLYKNYSVLRVPGPLYVLFEVYMLIYLIAGLIYLIYGARGARPSIVNRIRNRWWLLALVPFVVLHAYLIVANHFGLAKISSTVSIPIALTLFLVVTTYATHQYRLFDITFFLPWSKVRKRKTAFYSRIQAAVGEMAHLRSVKDVLDRLAEALRCQVALIGGIRPVVALANGQAIEPASRISEFPRAALQNVDHIVVANEIADSRPELHALMKQFRVGAIVPFAAHGGTGGNWMLLGEHFSDAVYTPLDFKVVEDLFARIAEQFADGVLLLRSQLTDAKGELDVYQRRLASAWDDLNSLRKQTATLETENRRLRKDNAQLQRQKLKVVTEGVPEDIKTGKKTLHQFLEQTEAEVIREALRSCRGSKSKAARLLGVWDARAMDHLLQRYGINAGDYS